MPILILGITSTITFDDIDMDDIENLEYTILLDLELFVNNNSIINSKTQKLVISNEEYEVHISLNKGMNEAYTKIPNHSNDNDSSDGSDSMGLNDLYVMTSRKEFDRFLDYINPTEDGRLIFHNEKFEFDSNTIAMMYNFSNHEL